MLLPGEDREEFVAMHRGTRLTHAMPMTPLADDWSHVAQAAAGSDCGLPAGPRARIDKDIAHALQALRVLARSPANGSSG